MARLYNIKVKGRQQIMTIDFNRFGQKLKEQCEVQNRQAVREWLKEVVKHIPGYTGTARGTLVPVGRLVNRTVQKFRPGDPLGDPERAKKKKYIIIGGQKWSAGFNYGSTYATATMGTTLQTNSILNSFIFDNTLPYVARNDISGPPPGFIMPSNPPWRSHDKAAAAWKKYVLTVIPKRLSLPSKFIKITTLRVR